MPASDVNYKLTLHNTVMLLAAIAANRYNISLTEAAGTRQ